MQKGVDNIYLLIILGMAGSLMLAFTIVLFYLRYQRRLMKQREQMQQAELDHKNELMLSGIQSQEEERRRIGKDLHDGVGGALSNLRFMLNRLAARPDDLQQVQSATDDGKKMIDDIISNVRTISHNLSPPGLELFGLGYTIDELCYQTQKATGIVVDVEDTSGDAIKALPFASSLSVYRVIQELLNNTLKHSGADMITVKIELLNDTVSLLYRDNGKGIDLQQQSKGMGMGNIESRLSMAKARWTLNSEPGKGMELQITLPLKTD
jgi:signal transduction histidine kinase